MSENWNPKTPIYQQIRDRVAGMIIDGSLVEGEAIPSVRSVASESKVNHLTVAKAYQTLVDAGVLELRRGLGMFVVEGAKETLRETERQLFTSSEFPALITRARTLGIRKKELSDLINQHFRNEGDKP